MKKRTGMLVYASMTAALVTLATMFIRIPIPMAEGYCNLGDALIIASGILLGPWAAAAAAVGSALADILLGYFAYAPVTALIKGLMGLISGTLCMKEGRLWVRILWAAAAECIMIGGYFLFEMLMYGAAAAAGSLLGNGCQAAAGVAAGLVMWPLMSRIRKTIR